MSDYKVGTCKWCGDKGDVYRDNSLCEECDSRTIHCSICRCRQSETDHCRHVFYSIDCGWSGAGVRDDDPEMKRPVKRLLSEMGEDFARDLREAITRRKFYTWIVAPMIGPGGTLDLGGMHHQWGDKLIALGERDHTDDLSDGFHWLQSLYKDNTRRANATTIAWINEWLWPFTPAHRHS